TPAAGTTTTALTVNAVTTAMNGYQSRAVFSNASGTVETSPASLTVLSAPVITINPVDTTVAEGEEAVFTAAATGVPTPHVQWEFSKNGGASWSKGPTTPQFVFPSANESENGWLIRAVFS